MRHLAEADLDELRATALRVREHIIKMATKGGCFLGASLSCADLIVYLYKHCLNFSKHNLNDPGRDYLLLSKGHDVPALYGTFVELGLMDRQRLLNHLKVEDDIYWHPNRNVPGVEFHSGSLGHLLSVSIGIALDCRMRKSGNKVVVILGDGELNEGSVWEAALVAAAFKLDNLIAVIDRNRFQANIRTEELIPLESLVEKFSAFGFDTCEADGHDFNSLHQTMGGIPTGNGKPHAVIARTVRGKGLPSIEERADRWFCNFTNGEIEQLLAELHRVEKAELTSESIVAR